METPSFMGLVSRFWRVFLPRGKCMSLTKCWNQMWLRPRSTIPLPRALSKVDYLMLSLNALFNSMSWNSQMCSLDTMEQSLRMAKHQVEKRTPWRELLTTQICRVSYLGRKYHWYDEFNILSSSVAGLSTTSSIISIQWKRTLSSTSRCPTLRSTWTNAEISLTVSWDQFAAQRNNLDFCSFQGQPCRPWRQGSSSLC